MSVISKENKKKLAEMIDSVVRFKNPVLETADGWVFSMAVGVLDDQALSRINPDYHLLIDQAAGHVANQQFSEAAVVLGEIAAKAVDTPLIDGTPEEEALYKNAFKLIADLIQMWVGGDKENTKG